MGTDWGVLVLKTFEPVLLGQDLRPAGVDEQGRVPDRQKARRRRGLGLGKRQAREVDELLAVLGAEPAQLELRERGPHRLDRDPRPVVDLGRGRGPEAAQVAAHELRRRPRPCAAAAAGRSSPRRGRTGRPCGGPRCPTGGTRTRESQALIPEIPGAPSPTVSWRRLRATGGSANSGRARLAAAAIPAASAVSRRERSHCSRRSSVTAAANVHQSAGVSRWMVERSEVPCTRVLRSSALVSCSRSNPSSRDQRPTYIEGAYWAWIPPIRSTAFGSDARLRSSSSWRASRARLSSRSVSVRAIGRRRRSRAGCRPGRGSRTSGDRRPTRARG